MRSALTLACLLSTVGSIPTAAAQTQTSAPPRIALSGGLEQGGAFASVGVRLGHDLSIGYGESAHNNVTTRESRLTATHEFPLTYRPAQWFSVHGGPALATVRQLTHSPVAANGVREPDIRARVLGGVAGASLIFQHRPFRFYFVRAQLNWLPDQHIVTQRSFSWGAGVGIRF